MHEHPRDPHIPRDPCERLLRDWQFRRQMAQSYFRALILLDPPSPGQDPQQRELRRDLNARLSVALLGLRHASDQLQACEREHAAGRHGA